VPKIFTTRRRIAVVAVTTAFAMAGGGAALAFFTSTGAGIGTGAVGSATPWTVTAGDHTGGPLLPGSGTVTIPYTIHNGGDSTQHFTTVTAAVDADTNGDISRGGDTPTVVTDCKAVWFSADAGTPSATTVAAGDDATVDVTLTMPTNNVDNQDACNLPDPGLDDGPNITLTVS
jgi:hypothetical protein